MILTNDQIKDIVLNDPHKELMKKVKDYSKLALMHVKGVGLKEHIQRINQFEPQALIETRKEYAVSNKDLFARLLRPIDKVFSAKGGSVYYNLPDTQAQQLKDVCSKISYGYSVRKWLQTFWMPAVAYDPMGLIFMEVDQEGKTYPTYKSVEDVFTYDFDGQKLEYVIFNKDPRIKKLEREKKGTPGKMYRVVDDVSDKIVEVTTEGIKEIEGQTFVNYYLRVPARLISDIYDPVCGYFVSNIDEVIEKANQFLVQGSVKNIFKNYFGFPQHWGYQSACPECRGTKMLQGRDCTHCKGTGLKQRTDPSETIHLPVPETKDQPILAPNVGGFITPDIEGWDKMDGELKLLEDGMFQTLWGTHQMQEEKNNTATGKFIDVQPVNDKLSCFSESAENIETFVVDMVGSFMFGTGYKGASITYGKRYLIETPDEIWTKYENARKNGAPTSALDDLYNDYLQARYSTQALELQKYSILAKVEPYKHMKSEELRDAPADIKLKKLMYSDWIQTMSDNEIILSKPEALREKFEEYCEEKMEEIRENMPQIGPDGKPIVGAAAGGKEEDENEEDEEDENGQKKPKKKAAAN